jgi:hypothetical protein
MACHLQIESDPDPAYHVGADPDPDPIFQFAADASGSGDMLLAVEFLIVSVFDAIKCMLCDFFSVLLTGDCGEKRGDI